MANKRIQVYADEELKRRIELAALKRDMAVTQYCLQAIVQQLAEDDMLEAEQVEISITRKGGPDSLMSDLRTLREEILASRDGTLIEPGIVEQVREERDHELLGMR